MYYRNSSQLTTDDSPAHLRRLASGAYKSEYLATDLKNTKWIYFNSRFLIIPKLVHTCISKRLTCDYPPLKLGQNIHKTIVPISAKESATLLVFLFSSGICLGFMPSPKFKPSPKKAPNAWVRIEPPASDVCNIVWSANSDNHFLIQSWKLCDKLDWIWIGSYLTFNFLA